TLVVPIVVWACRLIAHRGADFDWRRMLLWCIGILLASAFASCLPQTGTWPLPTGLCGVIGDSLLRIPALALGTLAGLNLFAVGVGTGLVASAALVTASLIGWRKRAFPDVDDDWIDESAAPEDDEDAEKASISLGWVAHGLLSLKARLRRMFTRSSAR